VVANYVKLKYPHDLGGVIGASAWLPWVKECVSTNTPVLLVHGENDERVPMLLAMAARDALEGYGGTVELKKYSRLTHSVDRRVLADLAMFIEKCLPPDAVKGEL
jgi:phospholipase/carboxylesterase